MILHLRYRSVCRYAHSGRSFFLLPLSADLLPARSVPVFYGIQYNCCRLSLFTSSENQVSQQTPPHYITSLFNIQPTILPEYVLFLLSFHKIHVSFLSCYVRLPKPQQRTEVKKGLQFFLQMLCCSKMTQKTRVQTERICIMLTGKTIILGVTGGIAAYKAANLASLLKKQHADVHVIMTKMRWSLSHR